MNLSRPALLLAALALVSGCALEAESRETVAVQSAELGLGGSTGWGWAWGLVGISLNGRSLAGKDLATIGLVGVSLEDVRYAGNTLRDVTLDATTFHAAHGHGVNGASFVGATFRGMLADGDALPLRIDAADATDERDVTLYAVSYYADARWRPLCGLDEHGVPVRAIPVAGRWDYRVGVEGGGSHIDDPDAFTFACVGYAIAKCVEIGYAPWREMRQCEGGHGCKATSLAELHQTCTRAIRADYCGDGTSFTHDGILIDMYDGFGFRTSQPAWPFEAEWTEDGASCAAKLRVPSLGTPRCWSRLQRSSCGDASHFASDTLLMTRVAP